MGRPRCQLRSARAQGGGAEAELLGNEVGGDLGEEGEDLNE